MLAAIGWAVFGYFVGGITGVLALALVASRKDEQIAMLAGSNKRLLGDCATASVRIVELERDLAATRVERDHWHTEAAKVIDVFVGEPWESKAPGECG